MIIWIQRLRVLVVLHDPSKIVPRPAIWPNLIVIDKMKAMLVRKTRAVARAT